MIVQFYDAVNDRLASRDLLDLDAPAVLYWPEFGKAGKEKVTV